MNAMDALSATNPERRGVAKAGGVANLVPNSLANAMVNAMASAATNAEGDLANRSVANLAARYRQVRQDSETLTAPLSEADLTVQSMEDASPGKWHLAHTSWFFEEFVLSRPAAAGSGSGSGSGYQPFSPDYRYLFNSYYDAVGPRQPRPRRGLLTRPPLVEVLAYRQHVDRAILALLDRLDAEPDAGKLNEWTELAALIDLIELGLQHEQQHQELILTDLLHLFAQNPLRPAYRPHPAASGLSAAASNKSEWIEFAGGLHAVGHPADGTAAFDFAFDCEGPRHQVFLQPFALAARPVSNGNWLAFIADDGYRRPELWLSDGWRTVQSEAWQAPLYWQLENREWQQMTLGGEQPLDLTAPVCQISYYEADAYARWAGKRLPTEFEWEHAASGLPVRGNFVGSGQLRPMAVPAAEGGQTQGLQQMFGDVWEWTASPYLAYPGFRAAGGALGEYNGKFMCGQMVLRGGSCVSPQDHLRATYRNFFYPQQRWQFSGLRLAEQR